MGIIDPQQNQYIAPGTDILLSGSALDGDPETRRAPRVISVTYQVDGGPSTSLPHLTSVSNYSTRVTYQKYVGSLAALGSHVITVTAEFSLDIIEDSVTFLVTNTPPTRNLAFNEQYQQQTEWCWAATTVSIALYYNSASTWTQCSLVDRAFNQTTCCQDGSSTACNQPWYPDQALTITSNLNKTTNGKPSYNTVACDVDNGHPVSIGINWNGGGGHNPAVSGYDNRTPRAPVIDLQDPWYGPSTQDFNSFPGSYNGGATWGESYFTN